MATRYRKTATIAFNANDRPLNQDLGYQAYGCSYSNLNDAWLQIGKYAFAAPNSAGTLTLEGDQQGQIQWASPPGVTQGVNTTGKVAYVTFTAEHLPNSGGPLALGMSNPMNTLGDLIIGRGAGIPTPLPVGTSGQVLTVVGGVPTWVTP